MRLISQKMFAIERCSLVSNCFFNRRAWALYGSAGIVIAGEKRFSVVNFSYVEIIIIVT